jgi:TatD DNase family protein
MNEPGFVMHVAQSLAKLKGLPLEQVAQQTSANFFTLFKAAAAC